MQVKNRVKSFGIVVLGLQTLLLTKRVHSGYHSMFQCCELYNYSQSPIPENFTTLESAWASVTTTCRQRRTRSDQWTGSVSTQDSTEQKQHNWQCMINHSCKTDSWYLKSRDSFISEQTDKVSGQLDLPKTVDKWWNELHVSRAHLQNQQHHLQDFVSISFSSQFPLFVSLFPDYLHYIAHKPANTAVSSI